MKNGFVVWKLPALILEIEEKKFLKRFVVESMKLRSRKNRDFTVD